MESFRILSIDKQGLIRILNICFKEILLRFSGGKYVVACKIFEHVFEKYYMDFQAYHIDITNKYYSEKNKLRNVNFEALESLEAEWVKPYFI